MSTQDKADQVFAEAMAIAKDTGLEDTKSRVDALKVAQSVVTGNYDRADQAVKNQMIVDALRNADEELAANLEAALGLAKKRLSLVK